MTKIEKARNRANYLTELAFSVACQDFFGQPRTNSISYYPSDVMTDWGWRRLKANKGILEEDEFRANPEEMLGVQIALNKNEITRIGVVMFSELG